LETLQKSIIKNVLDVGEQITQEQIVDYVKEHKKVVIYPIGAPASGKTTLKSKLIEAIGVDKVISISNDEAVNEYGQANNMTYREVFATLPLEKISEISKKHCEDKLNSVDENAELQVIFIDAVNETPKYRSRFSEMLKAKGFENKLHVFVLTEYRTMLNRNSMRPAPIPEHVINMKLKNMDLSDIDKLMWFDNTESVTQPITDIDVRGDIRHNDLVCESIIRNRGALHSSESEINVVEFDFADAFNWKLHFLLNELVAIHDGVRTIGFVNKNPRKKVKNRVLYIAKIDHSNTVYIRIIKNDNVIKISLKFGDKSISKEIKTEDDSGQMSMRYSWLKGYSYCSFGKSKDMLTNTEKRSKPLFKMIDYTEQTHEMLNTLRSIGRASSSIECSDGNLLGMLTLPIFKPANSVKELLVNPKIYNQMDLPKDLVDKSLNELPIVREIENLIKNNDVNGLLSLTNNFLRNKQFYYYKLTGALIIIMTQNN
jgi:predicted kinase